MGYNYFLDLSILTPLARLGWNQAATSSAPDRFESYLGKIRPLSGTFYKKYPRMHINSQYNSIVTQCIPSTVTYYTALIYSLSTNITHITTSFIISLLFILNNTSPSLSFPSFLYSLPAYNG